MVGCYMVHAEVLQLLKRKKRKQLVKESDKHTRTMKQIQNMYDLFELTVF